MGDGYRLRLRNGAISLATQHLGCSRSVLQRRMGVAESTLWRIERGDLEPGGKTVAGLLAVTGLDFDELFEVVENEGWSA